MCVIEQDGETLSPTIAVLAWDDDLIHLKVPHINQIKITCFTHTQKYKKNLGHALGGKKRKKEAVHCI
jgi:hypothetical protein